MTRPEELFAVMDAAAAHWQSHARCVASYLRGRGLDWLADDPATYGLGYAPYQWTELLDTLRRDGYSDATIETAGLAVRTRTGQLVDRFRGRLMFPIHDHTNGHIAGATGRDLINRPRTPKYLNTPTTPIFNKRRLLYGLHEQTRSGDGPRTIAIAEGPLDALTLHHRTIPAVATCGTTLTTQHVDALTNSTRIQRVILAFDGDRPGRDATIDAYTKLAPAIPLIDYWPMPPDTDPTDHPSTDPSQAVPPLRTAADLLIDQAIGDTHPTGAFASINAARRATRTLAHMPAHEWLPQITRIAHRLNLDPTIVKDCLVDTYQTPLPRPHQPTPAGPELGDAATPARSRQ